MKTSVSFLLSLAVLARPGNTVTLDVQESEADELRSKIKEQALRIQQMEAQISLQQQRIAEHRRQMVDMAHRINSARVALDPQVSAGQEKVTAAGSYVIWEGVGMTVGAWHSQLLLCPVQQEGTHTVSEGKGTSCDGKSWPLCFEEMEAGTDLGYQSSWEGKLFPDVKCTRIAYGGTGLSSPSDSEATEKGWKEQCSGLTGDGAGRNYPLSDEEQGTIYPGHKGKAASPPPSLRTGNFNKIYMGWTAVEPSELKEKICGVTNGHHYGLGFTAYMYTSPAHNCNWGAKKILKCILGLSDWWVPNIAVGDVAWCDYDTW